MFTFSNTGVVGLADSANTAITGLGTQLTGVWTGSDILTAFTDVLPLIVLGITVGLVIGIVKAQISKAKNSLGN